MKTHNILYEHLGENSNTAYTPIAVWNNQVNLDDIVTRCLNYDDNRLVEINRYKVLKVGLPDWLDPQHWIRYHIDYCWAWGCGVDKEWPEKWQRGLLLLGGVQRYVAIKLLKTKKFRSIFRKSLRDQLVVWLEADDKPHLNPFSPRQFNALVGPKDDVESKRLEEGLYYHFRYHEV